MTRPRSWRCCALILISVALLGTRPARASDERSVRFELSGPPGCADDARLASEVRARTSRVRDAAPGESPDLTLRVRIDVAHGAAKGELVLTDSQGASTRRELSGESCEAVVSGLALVAALAIDPSASTAAVAPVESRARAQPPPPPPSPPPPPPPAPPPMPAPVRPPLPVAAPSTERADVATADFPADTRSPESAESPEPPAPRRRWRSTVGIDAGILGVGSPGVVATGSLFADFALETRGIVAPSFRLSVHRSLETTLTAGPGESATLAWTFGRAEVCPLRLALSSTVDLRPCAFFDGGALYAAGSAPVDATTHLRPWAAAGALARLEWVKKDVSPGWDIVLAGQTGLVFPIAREGFNFTPSPTFYQAPSFTGLASVGVGVRFP
jgi:hypothetical protein